MTVRIVRPHRVPRRAVQLATLASMAVVPLLLVAATTHAPSKPIPPKDLPACSSASARAHDARYDQWAETLMDPSHGVGPDYAPPDLESQRVGARTVTLRTFVFGPLREMLRAASEDGAAFAVNSGYRSHRQQLRLQREMSENHDLVALPGHSEHQLGTTVDLAGGSEWLEQNAWRFGFILSYPLGRSPTWTCYPYEPWHFRYFGRERAAEINASGLSPREWLWQHRASAATS